MNVPWMNPFLLSSNRVFGLNLSFSFSLASYERLICLRRQVKRAKKAEVTHDIHDKFVPRFFSFIHTHTIIRCEWSVRHIDTV